jgi:hypothetical protein
MQRANRAHKDLRGALVGAVRRLSEGRTHRPLPENRPCGIYMLEGGAYGTWSVPALRAEPSARRFAEIRGLPYAGEHRENSVRARLRHSGMGPSELVSEQPGCANARAGSTHLVGLSDATTCYVSAGYFEEEDAFADFIVHEAAHAFHNSKRATVGLSLTRKTEWLLDIAYRGRKMFAYACQACACVLARGKNLAARRALAEDYAQKVRIPDERVDQAEVVEVVRAAAAERNGWRIIMAHCSANSSRG